MSFDGDSHYIFTLVVLSCSLAVSMENALTSASSSLVQGVLNVYDMVYCIPDHLLQKPPQKAMESGRIKVGIIIKLYLPFHVASICHVKKECVLAY